MYEDRANPAGITPDLDARLRSIERGMRGAGWVILALTVASWGVVIGLTWAGVRAIYWWMGV